MDQEINVDLDTVLALFSSLSAAVNYAYNDSPKAQAQKENLPKVDFLNKLIWNCYCRIQTMSPEEYERVVSVFLEINEKLNAIKLSEDLRATGKDARNDS
ncbi:MAG: hypothetical protein QNJ74_16140 [Trichodesmium sp. MO_231.B1]|nr:hypothetical protein [Trichodesmium sp. MO_231.B1]